MERDIHAKRSEEAACLDAMGEIDEKAALLKLPPKPTDRTPEDLRGLLDDVEDVERDIHAKRSEEATLSESVAELDERLGGKTHAAIRNDMASLKDSVRSAEEERESAERRIRDCDAGAGAKRNEIETLEESLRKAEGLGGRCDYCDSTLEPEYVAKLQSERKSRLEAARSELDAIDAEMAEASGVLEDCRKRLARDRESLDANKRDASVAEQRGAQETRLAALRKGLESLDPETYAPAGEPLAREDGETPRDYIRRLLDSLQEYGSTADKIRDLDEQRGAQETRLAALRKDLESLDPETYAPAGEPLAREDGETPRDYIRRLLDSLQEYGSTADKIRDLDEQRGAQEARLAALRKDLESLDPETYAPAGEPLAREDGETPRDYIRRLLDSLQEYGSTADKIRDLDEQRGAQEARLAALRKDLESLDPETYAPAGEPLAREDGETPRDYIRRLLESLRAYRAATDRIADLTERKTKLQSRMDEDEKAYERDDLYLQSRRKDLDKGRARLQGRGALERDVKKGRVKLDATRTKLDDANSEISAAVERIRYTEEHAGRLDADIKEAEEHRSRHDAYLEHEDWLSKYFIPAVREVEKSIMWSLRYDFNEFYEKWYSMLVDDPTKRSYVDDRFGPVLEQDSFLQSVDSLSGGEKTSVALAYRLAINSTMRRQTDTLKSNLLILDEPTDGFSKEQLEKVREILKSLNSEQVIIVSHETELEGFVDHVFRVTKAEGSSSVQKTK